jgi:NAD(P)-dependent dehydrogenase (short-subunit alcohol dehydrogenase family)
MTTTSLRLHGKKAVITAAASGMGLAGCELFCAEGATVAAVDRDRAALDATVEKIQRAGGQVRGFVADLSDTAATTTVMQQAAEWLGGLDVVWSHAGMPAPADVETLDLDRYRLSAELNLTSSVVVSGEAIRLMRPRGGGAIVFTSSTSGLVGSALSPLYSALKSGVIGLVKGLAVRYAAEGIRVNAICPGPVATPMLYNDFMNVDPRFSREDNEKRIVAAVPMGRVGQPIEVARAALWLASDDASYITGVALPIDGGLTAR